MIELVDHLQWAAALAALQVVAATVAFVLVVAGAVAARTPETRRHCLAVMRHVTDLVAVLRGKRDERAAELWGRADIWDVIQLCPDPGRPDRARCDSRRRRTDRPPR
jgi:hypothetical protein